MAIRCGRRQGAPLADDVSSQQEIKRGDRLDEGWSGAGNVHGCADRTGRAQSVPVIDVRSAKPQRGAYPQARHRAEPVRVGNEYLYWVGSARELLHSVEPSGAAPGNHGLSGHHQSSGGDVQLVRHRQLCVGVHITQKAAPAGPRSCWRVRSPRASASVPRNTRPRPAAARAATAGIP